MSPPMNLTKGEVYRGRVIISYPSIFVTHDKVAEQLRNVGFSPVTVWLDKGDVPWDWPSAQRDDVSGSGETQAWIEGTWNNQSGSYPSSGSKWRVFDYWQTSQNAPPPVIIDPNLPNLCGAEGYTCTDDAGCCTGLKCVVDSINKFGGGLRCQNPQAPIVVNPTKPKSSTGLWWVAGISVALLVGLALMGPGETTRRNPWPKRNPSRPIGSEKWVQDQLRQRGLKAANRNEPGFYVALLNARTGRQVRVWVRERGEGGSDEFVPEPTAGSSEQLETEIKAKQKRPDKEWYITHDSKIAVGPFDDVEDAEFAISDMSKDGYEHLSIVEGSWFVERGKDPHDQSLWELLGEPEGAPAATYHEVLGGDVDV